MFSYRSRLIEGTRNVQATKTKKGGIRRDTVITVFGLKFIDFMVDNLLADYGLSYDLGFTDWLGAFLERTNDKRSLK